MNNLQGVVYYTPMENLMYNQVLPSLAVPGGILQGLVVAAIVLIFMLIMTEKYTLRSFQRKWGKYILWIYSIIALIVWTMYCHYVGN